MRFKYVQHSVAGFILWPADTDLYHAHIGKIARAATQGSVLSAGFCTLSGGVKCFGKSESLGISSRPGDSEALARQLGLETWAHEHHIAQREAQHLAATEAYFSARPELDLPLGRKTFEAGFVRGFDHPKGVA